MLWWRGRGALNHTSFDQEFRSHSPRSATCALRRLYFWAHRPLVVFWTRQSSGRLACSSMYVVSPSPQINNADINHQVSGVSEDCLTLNVFRPSGVSSNASLPVMLWIYGGGFLQGVTSVYNASAIIAQSVLRVSAILLMKLQCPTDSTVRRERLLCMSASTTEWGRLASLKARRPTPATQ